MDNDNKNTNRNSVPILTSGIGTRILEVAESVGGNKELAKMGGISESQYYRIVSEESQARVETITKIAEATGYSLQWLITGAGDKRQTAQHLNSDLRLITGEFNRFRNTIATGKPYASAINDFVEGYNEDWPTVNTIDNIPHITTDELMHWLHDSQPGIVQHGNINKDINIDNLRSATELMISSTTEAEYNPPTVWSALIIELMVGHGLEPSGVERILETLAGIEERNKEK